ncbi:MAG: CHASE2 domain-containing protein [Cyanobacteria bacterium P01_F01_bin.56]
MKTMLPFLKRPTRRLTRLARKSSKWPIGYAIIAGVLLTRWVGLFSSLELLTLDFLLRNRPAESPDEQVVVIVFDRNTVQSQSDFEELSEQKIAQLLNIIFSVDPAAVGLNIFLGENEVDPGREQLIALFEAHPNLIGVEKVLPPRSITPPKDIPPRIVKEQFAPNDIPLDQDGRIRRTFLGVYLPDNDDDPQNNQFRFSFSFKLAKAYLEAQGYTLENHPGNPEIPVFKHTDEAGIKAIPILHKNSGGYFREKNISKLQSLLNFRSGSESFQIIEATQVLNRSLPPEFLRGKLVIVGGIDPYFPRFLPTTASSSLISEESDVSSIIPRIGIVGPELEAHSVSQIINAVTDNRPLIQALPSSIEYCLIVSLGFMGIMIGASLPSTRKSTLTLVLVASFTCALSYVAIASLGFWLPIVPMTICFLFSGVIYLNYRVQRISLKSQQEFLESQQEFLENQRNALIEASIIESERRKAIERAFSAIHAGPLQRLSSLLRQSKDGDIDREYVIHQLKSLNEEIRRVGERLRQEAIGDVYFFYSEGDIKLDLTHPMHEVLYEVYSLAVQRKLPGFESVKVRAVTIEPFNCEKLSLDIKRQLCWFLEESLQNIGKHAIGTTRIQVSGKHIDDFYSLKIEDNGPGIESLHIGDGTQSSYRLEALLRGKFSRFPKPGGGTVCELSWPSSIKAAMV